MGSTESRARTLPQTRRIIGDSFSIDSRAKTLSETARDRQHVKISSFLLKNRGRQLAGRAVTEKITPA